MHELYSLFQNKKKIINIVLRGKVILMKIQKGQLHIWLLIYIYNDFIEYSQLKHYNKYQLLGSLTLKLISTAW